MSLQQYPKSYRVYPDLRGIAQRNRSTSLPYSVWVAEPMRGVITGLFVLAAMAVSAHAGDLARHAVHPLHPAHSFVLRLHDERVPAAGRDAAPLLGIADMHYQARPSGLDRIDPSTMRVFGGEIGGEGVKGGAIVSLTWPTP